MFLWASVNHSLFWDPLLPISPVLHALSRSVSISHPSMFFFLPPMHMSLDSNSLRPQVRPSSQESPRPASLRTHLPTLGTMVASVIIVLLHHNLWLVGICWLTRSSYRHGSYFLISPAACSVWRWRLWVCSSQWAWNMKGEWWARLQGPLSLYSWGFHCGFQSSQWLTNCQLYHSTHCQSSIFSDCSWLLEDPSPYGLQAFPSAPAYTSLSWPLGLTCSELPSSLWMLNSFFHLWAFISAVPPPQTPFLCFQAFRLLMYSLDPGVGTPSLERPLLFYWNDPPVIPSQISSILRIHLSALPSSPPPSQCNFLDGWASAWPDHSSSQTFSRYRLLGRSLNKWAKADFVHLIS